MLRKQNNRTEGERERKREKSRKKASNGVKRQRIGRKTGDISI